MGRALTGFIVIADRFKLDQSTPGKTRGTTMETLQDHFSLARIIALCHGNTVLNPGEIAHLRDCDECEELLSGIFRQQRDRNSNRRLSKSCAADGPRLFDVVGV